LLVTLFGKNTEADSSGRLLGNDCRRTNGSAKMSAIGRSDMLSLSRRRRRSKALGGPTGKDPLAMLDLVHDVADDCEPHSEKKLSGVAIHHSATDFEP